MAKSNKFQQDEDQTSMEFDLSNGPIGTGPQGDPGDIAGEHLSEAAHDHVGVALQTQSQETAMDSSDFFLPNLRLAQGLTPEVTQGNAKPGQWLLMGIDPQVSIVAVPLKMTKNQELRDRDTNTVTCSSPDSVFGIGTPGGECSKCPMNQWTPGGANGKNNPPLCVFKYSFLLFVFTEAADGALTPIGPALFHAKRTSIQVGKVLNTFAMMNKGWGKFAVRFTSSNVTDGKKSYAKPIVNLVRIKAEDMKVASEMGELLNSGSVNFSDEAEDFNG